MKNLISGLFILLTSFVSLSAQQSNPALVKLYQSYINLKEALANDNAANASAAAKVFSQNASTVDYKVISEDNISKLKKDAGTIMNAQNISTQRNSFYNLSDNMAAIAQKFKLSSKPIYVQYCPMAKGQWLSDQKEIKNPYYGSSMLTCGNVKAEINK